MRGVVDFLFNVYAHIISKILDLTKIGCVQGNYILNNIFYADDLDNFTVTERFSRNE